MDPQRPSLSYDQLVGELRRLCAEKRTGTLFIITAENHSARCVLRQGEIVSLAFRLKRGREAIPFLQKIGGGRCTFSGETLEVSGGETLPPTTELLALLAAAEVALPGPGRPAPPAAGDPARLERAQQLIEPALAEFLGPMAPVICREYLLKASGLSQPDDLRDVIEAIAREIRDPVKEARFKQLVLARLPR